MPRANARPVTRVEPANEAVMEDPPVEPEVAPPVEQPADPATPEQDERDVSIVDLVTPSHPPRPVEVDLTCDLDDEVFVLLVRTIFTRFKQINCMLCI